MTDITAFAVVLGVAAGAVLRRTLPAMAVTLALYVAVQIAVPMWVRPHLLPPVTSTVSFSRSTLDGISLDGPGRVSVSVHTADRGDWVLVNETVGPEGTPAAPPQWFADCLPDPSAPASGTQRAAEGSTSASPGSPRRDTGNAWCTSRRPGSGHCSGRRAACISLRPQCSPPAASGGSGAA